MPDVFQPDDHLSRMLVPQNTEIPWYKSLYLAIHDLIKPEKLPPLELTSKPVAVKDIWGLYAKDPKSRYYSVAIHVSVFCLLMWGFTSDRVQKAIKQKFDLVDPNLKPLFAHGGKLLQYHGWADPGIPPRSSVNYYKSVLEAMGGKAEVNDNYRLFMVPGMGHCGGGDGTSTFDMVSAIDQWVVEGKAPDQIMASKVVSSAVVRTRPLCPYPQVATYKGSGSTDDAANFTCKATN